MILNNRYLFYLSFLILFKINSENIILNNKTGYDLLVTAKYLPLANAMPNILVQSIFSRDTKLNVSTNFITKVLLKEQYDDFDLGDIEVSYIGTLSQSSIVAPIVGYRLSLPASELKEAILASKRDIAVDLNQGLSGGINYKIYTDVRDFSRHLKEEELENSLTSLVIENSSSEPIIIRYSVANIYKFNQQKETRNTILYPEEKAKLDLLKYIDVENDEMENNIEKITDLSISLLYGQRPEDIKNIVESNLKFIDVDLNKIRNLNLKRADQAIIKVTREEKSSATRIGKITGLKWGGPAIKIDENDIRFRQTE